MISGADVAQVKPYNYEYLWSFLHEQEIELVSHFSRVFSYYFAQITKTVLFRSGCSLLFGIPLQHAFISVFGLYFIWLKYLVWTNTVSPLYNGLLPDKETSSLLNIKEKLSEINFQSTFIVIKKRTNLYHSVMFPSATALRIDSQNALISISRDSQYLIFMFKTFIYLLICHNPQTKLKNLTEKLLSLGWLKGRRRLN